MACANLTARLPVKQGFTLIEVLIAITLLALMMTVLFASLRTCADSWEKGEAKMAAVNELAVVQHFFSGHLTTTQSLWVDWLGDKHKKLAFQGTNHSLRFVSSFPASSGRVGLHLFSIKLAQEADETVLKVTIKPFFETAKGKREQVEEEVLLGHTDKFELAYFGSDDGIAAGTWRDNWSGKALLPNLVKLNIQPQSAISWPEIIIAIPVTGKKAPPAPALGGVGNAFNSGQR